MPVDRPRTPPVVRWVEGLAVVVVAAYLLMAMAYALTPSFMDHFEPGIALGALRVLAGEQAFHDPQSAAQYSSIYGPNAYLWSAVWIAFWPEVIAGSKLAGASAGLSFCVLFALVGARRYGRAVGVIQLALVLGAAMRFAQISYWNRPEPLQLLGVTLALLALTIRSPFWAALALGTAVAALVNLKIHSVLYVVPVIVAVLFERRWRVLAVGAVVAAIGLAMPFVATHLFSLERYGEVMVGAARLPWSSDLFARNVTVLLAVALPFAAITAYTRKDPESMSDGVARPYLFALAGAAALVCVIASAPGAGPHHLIPFLPVVVWALGGPLRSFVRTGMIRPVPAALIAGWVVIVLLLAARTQTRVWTFVQEDQGRAVIADLESIRTRYAGSSIQMGCAGMDQWPLYFYRPALRPHDPVDYLDVTMWMYKRLSAGAPPAPTRAAFSRGEFDIWLIPRGGAPFTLSSTYPPFDDVFGPDFRAAFEHGYRLAGHSDYFDIYLARRIGTTGIDASGGPTPARPAF